MSKDLDKNEKDDIMLVFKALAIVKKQKAPVGTIECPKCKGELKYSRSSYNGHTHGNCTGCDINWME